MMCMPGRRGWVCGWVVCLFHVYAMLLQELTKRTDIRHLCICSVDPPGMQPGLTFFKPGL